MKKINDELYQYKGIDVKKLSNGMYKARFYVNTTSGFCTVSGSTQASFKKLFNEFVRNNKGLDMKRYKEMKSLMR